MGLDKGYVQVYTGNGKGKTTAALGLALRAVGRGLKVIIIQFMKGSETGELYSVEKLSPDLKIYRFEVQEKFFWALTPEEKELLKENVIKGYDFALKQLEERTCDILILDEIMGTIHSKILEVKDVIKLIEAKAETQELILTGRNVPEEIFERADLVTEMKDLKHYFNKGVKAREGIED